MKKIFIFIFSVLCAVGAFAKTEIDVLSDADESLYSQIFTLQDSEKFSAAEKLRRQVADPILMSEVLYQKFFSKTYTTKGAEAKSWMDKYADMPGAVRVEKLAARKKTKVKKAVVPAMLSGNQSVENAQSETWTEKNYSGATDKKITKFRKAIRSGSTKTARNILEEKGFRKKLAASDYGRLAGRLAFVYYTNGEFELAKKWGTIAADADSEFGLWTMGLLQFKEENYKESEKYFAEILELPQINNARKTEAAFWAGRAADLNDDRANAKKYWRIAAAHPMAFYGALAATMLGDVPEYEFFEQEFTDDDVEELRRDKYGKIALALLQVNRKERAEEYLKYMMNVNVSDRALHAINSVATAYGLSRVSILSSGIIRDRGILEIDEDVIYTTQYPLPDWEPMGGWSIDRALLLAIIKQESGFRAGVKSGAGAKGVMQLMPGTAKLVARANRVKMSDIDMSNPEHNMFLGQQHIVDLLMHPNVNNNIIKMLAAYNAGMGSVVKFEKSFSTEDPLLYIESFPAYETRGYIKRVMANLWLYRARLNQPLTTLKVLADAQWPLYSSEDEYVRSDIDDIPYSI